MLNTMFVRNSGAFKLGCGWHTTEAGAKNFLVDGACTKESDQFEAGKVALCDIGGGGCCRRGNEA